MRLLITVACVFITAEVSVHCQPSANVVDTLIEHRHVLRNTTLADALSALVKDAHVSAGIVLTFENEPDGAAKDMEITDGTPLRDALGYILARSDARYTWSEHAGILSIKPRGAIPALLQSHILVYHWNILDKPSLSIGRLLTLSEVQQQMQKYGMDYGLQTGFGLEKPPLVNGSVVARGQDCVISDVSLEEALNAVARSYSVPTVWIYREAHRKDRIEATLSDR